MATVVVAGEVVLDRFIGPDRKHDVAGGSAANTALALHRAGHRAMLRARYSTNRDGRFLREAATRLGLHLEDSVTADQPATVVQINLTEDGVPEYQFETTGTADWQWTRQELARALPANCDALIVGSLASVLPPGCDALQEWAIAARESGVSICYDPNARPSAIVPGQAAEIRARIGQWVAASDIIKVSDEDLAWIAPDSDPRDVAAQWSRQGPQLVVLTAGPHGARAYRHGAQVAQAASPVIAIVDTVGAGDTLMAWLVGGLMDVDPAARYGSHTVEVVLQRAVRAAAVTCTRQGCQPPTSAELN